MVQKDGGVGAGTGRRDDDCMRHASSLRLLVAEATTGAGAGAVTGAGAGAGASSSGVLTNESEMALRSALPALATAVVLARSAAVSSITHSISEGIGSSGAAVAGAASSGGGGCIGGEGVGFGGGGSAAASR